ncbi:hypothetical protein B0H14DRAFT_3460307 [Mycena olivaceomarginata]|nr:hypothetical protein B0H14DRAFT_3460307 [Mycena olivaceomarginata]
MSQREPVHAWTPQLRLFSEDQAVFAAEPFATAFTEVTNRTAITRSQKTTLWQKLEPTLKEPHWLHIQDWLCFTLGAQIVEHMPEDAVIKSGELFLNVLHTRFLHQGKDEGEQLAYKLLEEAQMDNFRRYYRTLGEPPADFSLVEDLDLRDTWDSDSEAGDWYSDPEDMEDTDAADCEDEDAMDIDFVPNDFHDDNASDRSMSGLDLADAVGMDDTFLEKHDALGLYNDGPVNTHLPSFVSEPTHGKRRVIPPVAPKVPPALREISDDSSLSSREAIWAKHLMEFFYSGQTEQVELSYLNVVLDLVDMRALRPTVYRSEDFQRSLMVSGLFDLLWEIARPGNLLERTHPDVEQSFHCHEWKASYAELIVRWVEESVTLEEYEDDNYKFTLEQAKHLLNFISDRPEMHPWSFNPMAVYLFFSLGCFIANCDIWLVPCLRELKYPHLEGWNSETVFRQLKRLPVFRNPAEQALDPKLQLIIQETSEHDNFMDLLWYELYRSDLKECKQPKATPSDATDATPNPEPVPLPSNPPVHPPKLTKNMKKRLNKHAKKLAEAHADAQQPGRSAKKHVLGPPAAPPAAPHKLPKNCRHCMDLPPEQHCIRILLVQRQKCAHLVGAALTCAPKGKQLRPKPPAKRKKGMSPKPRLPPVRYFHPINDLHMEEVEHRPEVYKRCGKDIVRFIWRRKNGEKEMVGGVRFKAFGDSTLKMLVNNHRLVKVCAIRRRKEMERWVYGTMTGTGSRMATGGKKGDAYGRTNVIKEIPRTISNRYSGKQR